MLRLYRAGDAGIASPAGALTQEVKEMHPTVVDRLHMREYARGIGDTGLERACNADLVRYGYRDEVVVPYKEDGVMETTEMVVEQERAVPAKPRRGRKPMPRCEHNNIAGRCDACKEGE